MAEQSLLEARSAFADRMAEPPRGGNDAAIRVTERVGLGLATLMSRGDDAALSARIKTEFGVALASGSTRVARGEVAFVGTGPGVWLACREAAVD